MLNKTHWAFRALIILGLSAVALADSQAWAAGDATLGGDVFDTQCAECHSVRAGKNKKGPSLFASMGRKAGTISDFVYSEAMKQSGITWTPEKVQAYVAGPKVVVPGGKMKYESKMTPKDVQDLLAFLATLR